MRNNSLQISLLKKSPLQYFFYFLLFSIFLWFFIYHFIFGVISLILIGLLFYTIFNTERLYAIFIGLIILIPLAYKNISGILLLHYTEIFIIELVFFLYLIIRLSIDKSAKIPNILEYFPVTAFLLLSLFEGVHGFIRGYNTGAILLDAFMFFGYIFFFMPLFDFIAPIKKYFHRIVIGGTVGTVLIYLIYFVHKPSIGRFTSPHDNLYILAVPFLINMYILEKKLYKRLIYLASLMIVFFAATLTLTRGLWIALFIEIVIIFYILNKKKKISSFSIIAITLVVFLFGIVIYKIISILTGQNIITFVIFRFETLKKITEPTTISSLLERYIAFKMVIKNIKTNWIFGKGLGCAITYIYNFNVKKVSWIDNGYLSIIWKTGLVGLTFFLWIIFRLLKTSLLIIRTYKNQMELIYGISTFAFIIGSLVMSFTSSVLIKYHYNIIWATFFGITEEIYRRRL